MKTFLLIIFALTSFNAFANSKDLLSCTLKDGSVEYKFVFDDNHYGKDKGRVEIYQDGDMISSNDVDKVIDPDSHGDGWSFWLIEADNPGNTYELFMYAQYLQAVYITIPTLGFNELRVDTCNPRLAN